MPALRSVVLRLDAASSEASVRWGRWCRDRRKGCASPEENVRRAQQDHSCDTAAGRTVSAPAEEAEAERYMSYLLGLDVYPQPKERPFVRRRATAPRTASPKDV